MSAPESNANATRFCVDCVHYRKRGETYVAECTRKAKTVYDLVTGEPSLEGVCDAKYERNPLPVVSVVKIWDFCGKEGRHFEARPKPERKPSGFDLWAKWMGLKKE